MGFRVEDLNEAQKAEIAAVKNDGLPGPPLPHAPLRSFGQRASLKNGTQGQVTQRLLPTGGSQGNASLRGAPTGGRKGQGGLASGVQEVQAAPYQEREADPRHGGTASRIGNPYQHGSLIIYDRHVYSNVGTERQQAHPDSTRGEGLSPLADGPVRPSYGMVYRTLSPRYGTTGTRFLDNHGPFSQTTTSDGRPYPLGIQDGSPYTSKFGGAPGLTHVYGVRGVEGTQGPELGGPDDGPQKIRGGVPHGLHTRIQKDADLRAARRKATAQQRPSRVSRPANSKIAGQSYSQTVQHQDSTAITRLPRTEPQKQPGMHGKGLHR